jgi:hypothetical protein
MTRIFKICLLIIALLVLALPAFAQTPAPSNPKIAGVGLALFQDATPQIQGFGFLALPVSENKVFSYTDWDVAALPGDPIPGRIVFPKLQFAIRTGFAVHAFEITKGLNLYGLANAGIATTGDTVVGSFSGGGFLDITIGRGWGAILVLQVDRNAQTGTSLVPRAGIRYNLSK